MTIREAPLIIIEDRGPFLVLVSEERYTAILDVSTPEKREQSNYVLESLHTLGYGLRRNRNTSVCSERRCKVQL